MNTQQQSKRIQDQRDGAAWPVMVLAYNEERHIAACLDSIFASDPGRRFEVYVMANGCTDRTGVASSQQATDIADLRRG